MNYAHIFKNRTCDGPGVRVALYCQGCTRHCQGCHNPETWDPCGGIPYTDETKREILDAIDHPWIAGLSILGGEPMEPCNQDCVRRLLEAFRARFGWGKSAWLWTGCDAYRDLFSHNPEFVQSRWHTNHTVMILAMLDVIVDGTYVASLRDPRLQYRGSSNQRVIHLHEKMEE